MELTHDSRRPRTVETVIARDRVFTRSLLGSRISDQSLDRAWVWRTDAGVPGGVGGMARLWSGGDLPGPNVWVAVRDEFRRQGVGRSLAGEVERWAIELGARAIYATHALPERSDALAACRAMGYTESESAMEWELDARLVHAECDRLLQRLARRGRGLGGSFAGEPAGLWSDATRDAVARLHSEVLGGDARDIARRLGEDADDRFDPRVSAAVMGGDGSVAAAALVSVGRKDGRIYATVEGLFTVPEHRTSLVTPMLKRAVAAAYAEIGGTVFTMSTMDHHTHTRRLAERLGPVSSRRMVRPYKLLA